MSERASCGPAVVGLCAGRADGQPGPGDDAPSGAIAFGNRDTGVVELALRYVLDGDVGGAGSEPDTDRDPVTDHGHRARPAAHGFVDDTVEPLEDLLPALAPGHAGGWIGGPAEDQLQEA